MAEWLRRWTANPLGSARVGSNPILVEGFKSNLVASVSSSLHGMATQQTWKRHLFSRKHWTFYIQLDDHIYAFSHTAWTREHLELPDQKNLQIFTQKALYS